MSDKKPAITTNQVNPVSPEYPTIRKPAKGPMISTNNIEEIRKQNSAGEAPAIEKPEKKSREKKG